VGGSNNRSPEDMTLEELERALKPQQRSFVMELLQNGGNGTAAAIKAGYSPKSAAAQATRLLKNAKVVAYRRACARQIYSQLGLTHQAIGLHLYEIFQRCMEAKPHMSWDTDEHAYVPDGSWQFDARGAIKALDMLLRLPGDTGKLPPKPMTLAEKKKRLEALLSAAMEGDDGADRR